MHAVCKYTYSTSSHLSLINSNLQRAMLTRTRPHVAGWLEFHDCSFPSNHQDSCRMFTRPLSLTKDFTHQSFTSFLSWYIDPMTQDNHLFPLPKVMPFNVLANESFQSNFLKCSSDAAIIYLKPAYRPSRRIGLIGDERDHFNSRMMRVPLCWIFN